MLLYLHEHRVAGWADPIFPWNGGDAYEKSFRF